MVCVVLVCERVRRAASGPDAIGGAGPSPGMGSPDRLADSLGFRRAFGDQ